ncbi:acetyl/propionyl/methylcrotonyl-CoA carboxylase subunit alpha [Stenotrophomonas geniculata]|uniref:acetyl/propionyl/methylcrotonyl-CoA carboxylase subunit alpha n=1 Tax=Stenotrophomonas geniculata TaxID=86188 RepID=UPI003CCEF147
MTEPVAMFTKVLIANRGEIACRVIATCRRLGIATVAVYSDADRNARHVRLADEAIHIGPAAARESYLRGDALLDAARLTGAQAIHPGYGFLSENADFADACAAAGITFIGPPASAIRAMGDKSAAKALMAKAGVPLTPGYHGDQQEPSFLREQADAIGYPVLIKASAGGGGKGMRKVERSEDFVDALASCQREAASAFGNDHVLVEKYVERPRHIEIQVFGDSHGEAVYLFERDCSVQRRHQKVLEEAPAPGMSAERRAAMGKAAVDAARAVGYVGAGTVEFIAGPDGDFYFMEMNTRLQVEHPVTEYITGTDLVEWQLRVASGLPLPLRQEQLAIHGHAIEARLYAEDADRGFLPSTGTLRRLRLPAPSAHVRVDTGVEEGDSITPYYDPMIAKLIVWDVDRDAALRRMSQALADCQVVGVTTNAGFLRRLVNTDSFAHAKLDTALIEREQAALSAAGDTDDALWQLAAVAAVASTAGAGSDARDPHSPWQAQDGWRLGASAPRVLPLQQGERRHTLKVWAQADGWRVQCDDAAPVQVIGTASMQGLTVQLGERRWSLQLLRDGDQLYLFGADGQHRFTLHDPVGESDHAVADGGSLLAPMPGKIVATLVAAGTEVQRGTPLVVLEAMKMEHTLQAPADGTVKGYRAKAGDQVGDGAVLVDFEAA